MKRRLLIILLLVPALLVAVAASAWIWLWHTEAGARWAWQQAVDRLAESPRTAQLDGQTEGTLKRGLRLHGLRYHDADVTVTVEHAALAGGLGLSPATINVSQMHLRGLEVTLHEDEAGPADDPFPPPDLDLGLPLPLVVRNLEVDGAVIVRGDFSLGIDVITARLHWFDDARLEVTRIEAPEISGSLTLHTELSPPFALESEFRVDRLALPDALQAEWPWLPDTLTANGTVEGDIDALELAGTVRWPDWLPHADIEGRLDELFGSRAWSVRIAVPQATIPDPKMAADLNAVTLVAEGESEVLARWSAEGEANVRADGWPPGRAVFSVAGEGDDIRASATAPELFGGSLSMTAQAERVERTPWQGTLSVENVSIASLLEALAPHIGEEQAGELENLRATLGAEALDARLEAAGTLDPVKLSVDFEALETAILGRDMQARGTLEFEAGRLAARNLTVVSGASQVVINGAFTGAPGLDFELAVADLGDFLPDTAGRLSGTARYIPDPESGLEGARLHADLDGENITAFDWTVVTLRITDLAPGEHPASGVIPTDPPFAFLVHAQGIDGPAGPVDNVSASLAGTIEQHVLDASAELRGITVDTTLSGGREGSGWAGLFERLVITPPESRYFGQPWTLREPAPVQFTHGAAVGDACLVAETGSTACLDFETTADGTQQGKLTLASITPELFGLTAGSRLSFSQRLDGTLNWNRQPGEDLSATADFTVSAGLIVDETEDLELLHTRDGAVRFTLDHGNLTSGVVDLPFEGGGIDIDLAVPDLMAGGDSAPDGRIRIEASDLRSLSSFVPQLAQTAGKLSADITVGGTGANPEFDGAIRLEGGRAHVITAGLQLHDVDVTGVLGANSQVRLDGRFNAGEGAGELHGTLDLTDPAQPIFELRLTGDGLTLVDVPDLRLLADTDLTANWDGTALGLSGHIHVPSARFAPRYLPSETATESPDVVVVAGDDPRPSDSAPALDWNIRGQVEISMGDGVVVDLELARATMTGAVTFDWQGAPIPMARGEYNLQGEIQAYGQQLEITRALIRYPNVPANNPHLDIRGERTIYGNTMISRAGVFVHGTLKRPITEPYTVPVTNAHRARTLLITGSDFDYEQGAGTLNVGTYIAPRLYLSYGVGLFEAGNVIRARYELGNNFGVKATSGQDETGIDFTYTIEK